MKRIFAPLALIALVVAGCSESTEPEPTETGRDAELAPAQTIERDPAIRALTPAGRTIPASIDATGDTDVSGPLAAFLRTVPDGSTITFPKGARYRTETTLLVEARNNLTFDGNGATLFATTKGARTRSIIKAVGGTNLTFRNFTILGANPDAGTDGAFVVELEGQHAFDALGVLGLTIENNAASDIYGDFVHLGRMSGTAQRWTENVTIRGNKFTRSGRQGVTFFAARDVVVEDNSIGETRRSTFDFEPGNSELYGAERVVIRNNRIGRTRLNFLAAAGHGPVNDITVDNNTLTGLALQFYVVDKEGGRRQNWTITNNTSDVANFSAPHKSVMRIWRVDNLKVHGNRMGFNPRAEMYGVGLVDACDADVSANHFVGTIGDARVITPCTK